VCGDDVERGRPAPDLIHEAMKEQASMIHDTWRMSAIQVSIYAGQNAQVRWNIGVYQAHDRQELEQAPHTHLIGSVAEL
jgi:hypothetical protein